ncbi:MAG TPA: biopolymer transporter ExbD [Phycisphaerales bacterium]|nr:biopolymer transporter ExbD [Phycisphaerales bacterium]
MLRLHRTDFDLRVEMTPLMDVIFLLLTFFVYALVLMIRAEVIPVKLQQFASAKTARPVPAITISIDSQGRLFLDREQLNLDDLITNLKAAHNAHPEATIYLASEEHGETDRLPGFLSLYDRLLPLGLDIKIVGRPKDQPASDAPKVPQSAPQNP